MQDKRQALLAAVEAKELRSRQRLMSERLRSESHDELLRERARERHERAVARKSQRLQERSEAIMERAALAEEQSQRRVCELRAQQVRKCQEHRQQVEERMKDFRERQTAMGSLRQVIEAAYRVKKLTSWEGIRRPSELDDEAGSEDEDKDLISTLMPELDRVKRSHVKSNVAVGPKHRAVDTLCAENKRNSQLPAGRRAVVPGGSLHRMHRHHGLKGPDLLAADSSEQLQAWGYDVDFEKACGSRAEREATSDITASPSNQLPFAGCGRTWRGDVGCLQSLPEASETRSTWSASPFDEWAQTGTRTCS